MRTKILAFTALPILLVLVFCWFTYTPPYNIFPGNNIVNAYYDTINGGNSQLHNFATSDSAISFSYTLKRGYSYPYVAVSIQPASGRFLADFSRYHYLYVTLKSSSSKTSQFYINCFEPGVTRENSPLSYRILINDFNLNSPDGNYKLYLNDFLTADWWYGIVHRSAGDLGKPHLDKVTNIMYHSSLTLDTDIKDEVIIAHLSLRKDYSLLIWGSIVFLSLYYSIGMALYKRGRKTVPNTAIVPYVLVQAENISDRELKKILDYISVHYNNPNLSLQLISSEIGLSPRTISDYLKKSSNLSYNQYINQIRLCEAKRLLKSTDLPVADLSFKVGYNNVTHFNRTFRQYYNISPSEYRNGHCQD